MDIKVGDILTMKKAHPCGSYEWRVTRVGADLKMKCLKCGREIMTPRAKAEHGVKKVTPEALDRDGSA